MTPLAAHLSKQLISRHKHREHIWKADQNIALLKRALDDVHCFEVTACLPLMADLVKTIERDGGIDSIEGMFEKFAFLPAPKTWLEWKHGSGNRIAVLLEERPGLEGKAFATFFCDMLAQNLGTINTNSGDHFDFGGRQFWPKWISEYVPEQQQSEIGRGFLSFAHGMLLLVNSPKIIGRKQHMPNAGLERKLIQGFRGASFPLHAWTEILLKVAKPIEVDDGLPHEAHLTGQRALHFVRKHIRIRLGRLEYVSSHWRGDPSVGIKQTRYTVQP